MLIDPVFKLEQAYINWVVEGVEAAIAKLLLPAASIANIKKATFSFLFTLNSVSPKCNMNASIFSLGRADSV